MLTAGCSLQKMPEGKFPFHIVSSLRPQILKKGFSRERDLGGSRVLRLQHFCNRSVVRSDRVKDLSALLGWGNRLAMEASSSAGVTLLRFSPLRWPHR